ncbi:hypothetical protein DINM_006187 [Dirofilaria immitis]|nr:hypothetical protein [Dirofilaria immitis]
MGNVLKRNHIKTSALNHSLSYGLYRKKSKSFSKPKEAKVVDLENNTNMNEPDSWTTTIGTLSVPFSLSIPTGESEQNISEESTTSQDDCILSSSSCSKKSSTTSRASNTSADFSSFKNLSKISEHTTVRLRPDDIEWMNDVRKYQDNEPKAALKIQPRKMYPRLKWHHLYHQWALRQTPKAYKGKDVLNPYIDKILEGKNDIDVNSSDLERGIFYLKCTNC